MSTLKKLVNEAIDDKLPKYPMSKWWKNDPDVLLRYVYWLKKQMPPIDPKAKKREWLKLMDQMAAKHKAPYNDFKKMAQHKFK